MATIRHKKHKHFLDHEEHEDHEEIVNRGYLLPKAQGHKLTLIHTDFVFASFGVFGHTFPRSKLLRKARPYPPGHFSMPHLGSWRKRCFISREKAQKKLDADTYYLRHRGTSLRREI